VLILVGGNKLPVQLFHSKVNDISFAQMVGSLKEMARKACQWAWVDDNHELEVAWQDHWQDIPKDFQQIQLSSIQAKGRAHWLGCFISFIFYQSILTDRCGSMCGFKTVGNTEVAEARSLPMGIANGQSICVRRAWFCF
jgi:hypothetical protein